LAQSWDSLLSVCNRNGKRFTALSVHTHKKLNLIIIALNFWRQVRTSLLASNKEWWVPPFCRVGHRVCRYKIIRKVLYHFDLRFVWKSPQPYSGSCVAELQVSSICQALNQVRIAWFFKSLPHDYLNRDHDDFFHHLLICLHRTKFVGSDRLKGVRQNCVASLPGPLIARITVTGYVQPAGLNIYSYEILRTGKKQEGDGQLIASRGHGGYVRYRSCEVAPRHLNSYDTQQVKAACKSWNFFGKERIQWRGSIARHCRCGRIIKTPAFFISMPG
jgi:hypothetical protein